MCLQRMERGAEVIAIRGKVGGGALIVSRTAFTEEIDTNLLGSLFDCGGL